MGGAMLRGWLAGGISPKKLAVLDPAPPPEVNTEIERWGVALNPSLDHLAHAQVIVIAVKPQIMDKVLPSIRSLAAAKPLFVSLAAGKTIASFEHHFGTEAAIIRTMPNLPASVGRGITALVVNRNVTPSQQSLAESLLAAVGEVVTLEHEGMIDAVTAVSGSGPAYVFYLVECLAEAGRKLGLSQGLAAKLARATIIGSGELLRTSPLPASALRENVTSPQGTTHAALQILMADSGMMGLIEKAVAAAENRSRELAS